MWAAPQRLSDNSSGPLYVNDRCINCAACSMFAPTVFGRSSQTNHHIVEYQPQTEQEMEESRAALRACPVAAIRIENQAFRNHRNMEPLTKEEKHMVSQITSSLDTSFPRPVSTNIQGTYFVGHHNSASFGAAPYLIQTKQYGWILIDSPKYSNSAVKAIESLTGPQGPSYLILTHVDDTAGHGDWKEKYPKLKRVFHSGDLGKENWIGDDTLENVEIFLPQKTHTRDGWEFMTLEGESVANSNDLATNYEVLLLHTPGHSKGSITLWKVPSDGKSNGILFTGDTYSYTTRNGGHMTGFPRYGNDLDQQAKTLTHLLELDWHFIAPGHGHVRDYTTLKSTELKTVQANEMQHALDELSLSRRRF